MYWSFTSSQNFLQERKLDRSSSMKTKFNSLRSFLNSSIAAEVFFRSLQAQMTSQPWYARVLAVSRPIPSEAPVIIARRPVKSFPWRTEKAVDEASKRWRIGPTDCSSQKANLGSVKDWMFFSEFINKILPSASIFLCHPNGKSPVTFFILLVRGWVLKISW